MTRNRSTYAVFSVMLVLLLAMAYATYIVVFNPAVSDDAPVRSALTPGADKESYTDLDGNQVVLDDAYGNYVLVYSWASWCPQCEAGLVEFDALVAKLDQEKVTALAVNRGEDKYTAQRFLNTLTPLEHVEIVIDPSDNFFSAVDGYAMPEIILFDTAGDIIYHGRGQLDPSAIENAVIQ